MAERCPDRLEREAERIYMMHMRQQGYRGDWAALNEDGRDRWRERAGHRMVSNTRRGTGQGHKKGTRA